MRQENERKIATITRETKKKIASATASDNINNNDQFEDDEEFYRSKNLIISQHVMENEGEEEDDKDANGRLVFAFFYLFGMFSWKKDFFLKPQPAVNFY